MRLATLESIVAARRERRPIALATDLATGTQQLIDDPKDERVVEAFASDRAGNVDAASGRLFIQPFSPAPRLLIVGAVHIAQHLAPLAAGLGHAVHVVDPRSAFATEERFPDTPLHREWPDEAIGAIGLDARSALVTLSHDPKIDDPALACALASEAYYIGCLGSRRTQEKRRGRLEALGFGPRDIQRLHGPVGLDIGARSPAEIALSIAAELTLGLRRGARAQGDPDL